MSAWSFLVYASSQQSWSQPLLDFLSIADPYLPLPESHTLTDADRHTHTHMPRSHAHTITHTQLYAHFCTPKSQPAHIHLLIVMLKRGVYSLSRNFQFLEKRKKEKGGNLEKR